MARDGRIQKLNVSGHYAFIYCWLSRLMGWLWQKSTVNGAACNVLQYFQWGDIWSPQYRVETKEPTRPVVSNLGVKEKDDVDVLQILQDWAAHSKMSSSRPHEAWMCLRLHHLKAMACTLRRPGRHILLEHDQDWRTGIWILLVIV